MVIWLFCFSFFFLALLLLLLFSIPVWFVLAFISEMTALYLAFSQHVSLLVRRFDMNGLYAIALALAPALALSNNTRKKKKRIEKNQQLYNFHTVE